MSTHVLTTTKKAECIKKNRRQRDAFHKVFLENTNPSTSTAQRRNQTEQRPPNARRTQKQTTNKVDRPRIEMMQTKHKSTPQKKVSFLDTGHTWENSGVLSSCNSLSQRFELLRPPAMAFNRSTPAQRISFSALKQLSWCFTWQVAHSLMLARTLTEQSQTLTGFF